MTTNHDGYYPHACCTLQHSISLLTNFDKRFDLSDKNVGLIILQVFVASDRFVEAILDFSQQSRYP